ncbi:hypothetical protein [Streptomyces sp. NPDC056663]|uniref:hypothetical protein n=1 Tax=Streptomyces sp. NPDC056663 TaxID=3345899 RepID=UPI00368A2AC0
MTDESTSLLMGNLAAFTMPTGSTTRRKASWKWNCSGWNAPAAPTTVWPPRHIASWRTSRSYAGKTTPPSTS